MSSDKLSLLIVEDDAGHAKIVRHVASEYAVVDHADSIADAKAKLLSTAYDILILDQQLPDGLGSELQGWVLAQGMTPRIVFVTGDESCRESVIGAGAVGFVLKEGSYAKPLTELMARVCRPGLQPDSE
jgi:two-component system OmpR family response regulator